MTTRMKNRAALPVAIALVATLAGFPLRAEVVIAYYDWTGSAASSSWQDSKNWAGGGVPPDDGNTQATFENALYRRVIVNAPVVVASLFFRADGSRFRFEGSGASPSLTINSSVIVDTYYAAQLSASYNYGPSQGDLRFDASLPILLPNASTWTIPHEHEIFLASTLTGAAQLTKFGQGQLVLAANNSATFSGTITVVNGYLGLADNLALGSGALLLGPTASGNPALTTIDGDISITNPVNVTDTLRVRRDPQRRGTNAGQLTLAGTVTLLNNSTFSVQGGPLQLTGTLAEDAPGTRLTVANSNQPVIFAGTSTFTGGLSVLDGLAVFLNASALPAAPATNAFEVAPAGYLGLGDSNTSIAAYLDRFDRVNTQGTLGFDTSDAFSTPNIFGGAIDLTGFNADVRLGSATRADLGGTITPPAGADYRFGHGGGRLTIGSLLSNDGVNPRGVNVGSPSGFPLLLTLSNPSNTFTGPLTVARSGVIIQTAGAVPESVPFVLFQGAYIGLAHSSTTVADYIAQFPVDLNTGIIGFDSADKFTPRTVASDINLSGFTSALPEFFLGSSTNVVLTGNITPPANSDAYRFAGYRGGTLSVQQVLADGASARSVFIGDTTNSLTHRSPDNLLSTVVLGAANTHSSGTYLQMGRLLLTNSGALGTGSFVVSGGSVGNAIEGFTTALPMLETDAAVSTLTNPIVLSSSLQLRNDSPLTLSGVIDGYGDLLKSGAGNLTLSGDNAFFGGDVYVSGGSLTVASDNALGLGRLGFGSISGLSANFTSAAPRVGGLYDLGAPEVTVFLGANTTLTINAQQYSYFSGSIQGAGGLEIIGSGEQTLAGANTYSGGTVVRDNGTLVVSNSDALGLGPGESYPVVNLNNGTLILDDTYISADLSIDVVNGGKLSGNGTLFLASPLTLGDGAILSPGWSIGNLSLDGGDVTLASGGRYDFEFADGLDGTLITDSLHLYSAEITATDSSPFYIRLGTANYDWLQNFNPDADQSWTLFTTDFSITNFDAAAFSVSLDFSFYNDLNGGSFSVGYDGLSTVSLTFTPVPEPSTFALLLLGLSLVGFSATRRRPRA